MKNTFANNETRSEPIGIPIISQKNCEVTSRNSFKKIICSSFRICQKITIIIIAVVFYPACIIIYRTNFISSVTSERKFND